MKRITLLMILVSFFLCCCSVDANLFQNPGFEDGMTYWEMVEGTSILTTYHRNGQYSMRISSTGRIRQSDIPVTPNTNYIIWMWDAICSPGTGWPHTYYRIWVNDSLLYDVDHSATGVVWKRDGGVMFNTEDAETISVTFYTANPFNSDLIAFDDMILVSEDLIPPTMVSAEASDGEIPSPGIDDDDYVVIGFSEPTQRPVISAGNIDDVLALSGGHTWLNGAGNIGARRWNETGDSLWIYPLPGTPAPTVFPGDTITPDGATIVDEWGNPVTNQVVIGGSFGGEFGDVAGNVNLSDTNDNSGALVTILETSQSDITDVSGDYFIGNILIGTYTIGASKPFYESQTLPVEVLPMDTTIVNFTLDPLVITPPFFTDFEADNGGFLGEGDWEWGVPTTGPNAHSGEKCWATNLDGYYATGTHPLYMPPVDLGFMATAQVSFYHWYEFDFFGDDYGYVQASLDGQTWTNLSSYSEESYGWVAETISLDPYVGNVVFLRFQLVAMFGYFYGWYIDDVGISGEAVPISVSIPFVYGAPSDTVSVPINVEDVTGFGILSSEFTISSNSTVITGIGVDTSGTLLPGTNWSWEYNVVGDIFSVAMAGTDTLAGSGTLINLIFVVSPDAGIGQESPLHFVDFMFNEGIPPATTEDGVFTARSIYGDVSENGEVHAYDASLIFQYLLGQIELTPTQWIVAEVSGNDTVEAYDASLILQYVVGLITEFPVESGALPPLTQATLDIDDISGVPGETITLPILVDNPEDLYSADMILSYDPDILTPVNVTTSSNTPGWLIGHKVEDDNLRIILAGSTSPDVNGNLVLVTFEVADNANNGCNLTLRNVRLNEQPIIPEAATAQFTPLLGVTEGKETPTQFGLFQNSPNPVISATQINYAIPTKTNVTLRIYNATGRLVKTLVNEVKEPGYWTANWDAKNIPSGIYFYVIETNNYRATRKLAVLK